MTTRSRSETSALVQKLQRERRRGLILGFTGAGILITLIIVHFVTMRGNNIPQVPGDVQPRPAPAVAPAVTGFGAPSPPPPEMAMPAPSAMASPTSPPAVAAEGAIAAPRDTLQTVAPPQPHRLPAEPPPPSTPGFLRASFPKNATVFLDDAQLGRSSGQSMLEPGQHVIRARLGKKTLTQKIELKPGENIAVMVDGKGRISVDRR